MNYPAKYMIRVIRKAIKLYGYGKPCPQVKMKIELKTVTQPSALFLLQQSGAECSVAMNKLFMPLEIVSNCV